MFSDKQSIKKGENLIHMYLSSHDNEAIGYLQFIITMGMSVSKLVSIQFLTVERIW